MQKPERLSLREFVKFYAVEIPTALVGIAVMVAIGWAAGSMVNQGVAHASVGPRPTVQLVKTFKCWVQNDSCPGTVESEVNAWLKDVPPVRIIERKLKVTERHLVLVIFYEVPEWRVPPQPKNEKLPAEAPPK